MNSNIDSDIISMTILDPHKGFSRMMSRYKEPVYWHIRRIVGCHEDADDATQETFVKIFRSLSNLSEVENLRAWIYRIASNEALRLIQQRQPSGVDIDSQEARTEKMYADDYFDYSDIDGIALQKAIDSLPTKQKMIFCLRYYDDLPYDEISKIASTSVTSAKVNYHFAKTKVIAHLKAFLR